MTDELPGETALADTSLFIALEQHRATTATPPARVAVSVVTIAELRLGVLAATDAATRSTRIETLLRAQRLDPLVVDERVAAAWADLRLALRDAGRRMPINDSWIAATAMAHRMSVVTQDDDYDDVPGLSVIRL